MTGPPAISSLVFPSALAEAIRSGRKRRAIRSGRDPVRPGDALILAARRPGGGPDATVELAPLVRCTSVEPIRLVAGRGNEGVEVAVAGHRLTAAEAEGLAVDCGYHSVAALDARWRAMRPWAAAWSGVLITWERKDDA